jgi:molecular chaperone GrpE
MSDEDTFRWASRSRSGDEGSASDDSHAARGECEADDEPATGIDQHGSEVDDYTGEIPRADVPDAVAGLEGVQTSGFGGGDVADFDIADFDDPDVDASELSSVNVMDALIAERDEMKAVAMRLQADFENFRKRTAAQHVNDVDRATGRLAEALLPVLDAAEAAFLSHPDEVGPVLNVMLAELRKQGLESLDLESQPFDPEVAEAVAHEPGDNGDVVVAEVLRSGYRWRGKTLRPAMVRTRD